MLAMMNIYWQKADRQPRYWRQLLSSSLAVFLAMLVTYDNSTMVICGDVEGRGCAPLNASLSENRLSYCKTC